MPPLRNLASAPRLGASTLIRTNEPNVSGRDAATYVHVHTRPSKTPDRPVPGVSAEDAGAALWLEGASDNTDSYASPGGREGAFRIPITPGTPLSVAVEILVPRAQKGSLPSSARRLMIGISRGDKTEWNVARSTAAPNEPGRYRLSATCLVPIDATGVFLRLICGSPEGAGTIGWDRLIATNTRTPVAYFDEHTVDDRYFTYAADDAGWPIRVPRPVREVIGNDATCDSFFALALPHVCDLHRAGLGDEATEWVTFAEREFGRDAAIALRSALLGTASDRNRTAAAAKSLESSTLWDHLGDEAITRKDWGNALTYATNALRIQATPARNYTFAFVKEHLGHAAEARKIVLATVKSDPQPDFDIVAAAEQDSKAFRPRLEVAAFLRENLDEIRERFMAFTADLERPTPLRGHTFAWWEQGLSAAPPVVTACTSRASRLASDVVLLDSTLLDYWTEIPSVLTEQTSKMRAQFSDILRLELLARHGGLWIDATCYPNPEIFALSNAASDNGHFVAFSYGGARISSWCLAAPFGSTIIGMLRAALWLWWEKKGYLNDYFLFHHLFELLVFLDEDFAQEWARAQKLSAYDAHASQRQLLTPVSQEDGGRLLGSAPAQKLKYQYQGTEVRWDSLVARLIRGQIAGPAL